MASFTKDEIVSVLREDKKKFRELKKENQELREKIDSLVENNQEFAELVQNMDKEVKELTENQRKRYEYHFEKGGWDEKGSLDEKKMKIKKDHLDLKNINAQLEEIVRMLKIHKKEKGS